MLMLAPLYNANAQNNKDEFGIWATVEASKKINKKFKVVADAEFRTYDFVSNVERATIGAKIEYKIQKWLKANVGYSFMYTHEPEEKSIKDEVEDEEGNVFNEYNIDHDYWTIRNRFYATVSGEGGQEVIAAGTSVDHADCHVTVRWCKKLDGLTSVNSRIVMDDEIYDILSIDHLSYKRRALKFRCRKVRR